MSAEAGPGPSSMASSSSSPIVPTSARQYRIKKRVINLVNPADPEEFSGSDFNASPASSANNSHIDDVRAEIDTPALTVTEVTQTYSYTPGSSAVRGILRPTGTPGSGNGVRFFPKNKFRIITPNQSLIAAASPQPKPKPAPSPTNSFFSQLLAVTIPAMSPRRTPVKPEPEIVEKVNLDESWEVPGQEGEISMVASTASADRTMDSRAEGDESVQEESWNGEPEVHCSPLALPSASSDGNTSKDVSFQNLELPSAEWQLPEDMSNLLSTRFNPEDSSCSLAEAPSMLMPRNSPLGAAQPVQQTESETWEMQTEQSESSEVSEGQSELMDDNPTIRRRLSPMPPSPQPALDPETPTPTTRPFTSTSIFADMSAEQADLTWPLTRRDSADEDETGFQSAIMGSSPVKLGSITPKTPNGGIGDTTEFFDCTAMVLSPPDSSVVLRASPFAQDLVVPTQALFDAQAAHTTALSAELDLYRSLAQTLQNEVVERDGVLAKLNLRALEAEVLQSQVADLRDELAMVKSVRQKSLSPSPSPSARSQQRFQADQLSDRTMAAQSEAKDLEIRLAKALGDAAMMTTQLAQVNADKQNQADELAEIKASLSKYEDAERDRLVKAEGQSDELGALRAELEIAHARSRQMEEVEDELQALKVELDSAHRQLDEIDNKEDELHAIRAELDEAQRLADDADERKQEVEDLRAELEEAHGHIDELEEQVQEATAIRQELDEAQRQIERLTSLPRAEEIQDELEEAQHRIAELETLVSELKEVKLVNEEEMDQLLTEIDQLKSGLKEASKLQGRLAEIERRAETEYDRRQEVERKWKEEKEERKRLGDVVQELQEALVQAEQQQSSSSTGAVDDSAVRAEISRLRSESASKDLEILDLQRRKAELKEDREMLNIALDSKQQELELMKRRFSVKGIAGSTPLGASRRTNLTLEHSNNHLTATADLATPATSKTFGISSGMATRRRSSVALQTPVPGHKHGIALHPSTRVTNRVMRKVSQEENRPPVPQSSVRRREREMMLA